MSLNRGEIMGYSSPKSFHDIRRYIRFPTDFRAVLHWDDEFAAVEIADISDGGIRFIGNELPAVGSIVRIGARNLDERGRVMWRTRHGCGVLLTRRINALSVVRANCFPTPRREGRERPAWSDPHTPLPEILSDIFLDEEGIRDFINRPVSAPAFASLPDRGRSP
ncbi:PilZ domain-containing protein [Sphingobium nicotianae]|uniref:PilZ domain-containing protein n=1 Tax=Sphingobium nicotianae TaxID=2782607 RepID=UPI0032D8B91E